MHKFITFGLTFLEDIQKWWRDQKYNCDLVLDHSDHSLLEQDPISFWPEQNFIFLCC